MATFLKKSNNFKTTLATDVAIDATTITVDSVANAPSGFDYPLTIWDEDTYPDSGDDPNMEIVKVTAASGTTLTVTRAQEDRSAAAHTSGDRVSLLLTKAQMDEIESAINSHTHTAGDGGELTKYLLVDGTRDLTGDWTIDTNNIVLTNGNITLTGGVVQTTRLGVGTAPTEARPLIVLDGAVDYVATVPGSLPYWGISSFPAKTGGATTNIDDFGAAGFYMTMDQAGGTIGDLYGSMNRAILTDGNVGDGAAAANIYGARAFADLDGGKAWGYVAGLYAQIDQEAANEIVGDGRVIWLRGDFDGTVTGNAIMLYLDELTGVDYGIYQDGTADNVLGGTLLMLDKIIFTQPDGNESIDSLNDGYVDYGATTAHRFNNDVRLIEDTADTASPKLSFYGGNTRTGTIQQLEDAASFSAFVMATNGSIELQTDTVARLTIDAGGDVIISGELEMDGALNHDGATAGFYGTTPIAQALLATGAGATVDNVITALQNLGLVKQT